MATKTENYGFNKPEMNDYASMEVLVETFDEIDEALKDIEDKLGDIDVSDQIKEHNEARDAHEGMFAEANHSHSAEDVGAATAAEYTITVGTVWTGSEAPFTQTIAVTGILTTDEPIVDISLSDDYDTMIAQLEDYAKIIKLVTANNSVTVYFNDQTLEVLTLRLKVIR